MAGSFVVQGPYPINCGRRQASASSQLVKYERTANVVSEGRRVKIVCTMGPAVSSPEKMRAIVDAGMDVARLNLSHGDYSEHEERYHLVRQAAAEAGRTVAVLVDLQGPKIRLGRFAEGSVVLVVGQPFTITIDDIAGDVHRCSTTHKGLPNDAKPGDRILVDDGRLTLEVTSVTPTDVHTVVILGGKVSNNKGLNLPSATLSVPAMSEKDLEDLRWGLRIGADMIAVSFVQRPEDVDAVHAVMDELGIRLPVIAKIEKPRRSRSWTRSSRPSTRSWSPVVTSGSSCRSRTSRSSRRWPS